MILTGQLDLPFGRRVAIALHIYGLAFEHNVISAYGDFDELLTLNPLGKVPALELDDGNGLADLIAHTHRCEALAPFGAAPLSMVSALV